jgi:hypothetical protein
VGQDRDDSPDAIDWCQSPTSFWSNRSHSDRTAEVDDGNKAAAYMTSKQVAKIVHNDPFKPFRVLLDTGEEIVVEKPNKASVSGDQVALVGLTRWPNGNGKAGLRFVLVDRIVEASHLDSASKS